MPSLLDILGYAGNLLDLPGSSVRDILAGRNPFDQWATPFQSVNRASGRDVLAPLLGQNEETGMSGWLQNPMEGVKDIAGFGLEVVADPLNFVSLSPLWRALKGRKAAQAANSAELAASKGRYGYVNPKVLADDYVPNPIAPPKVVSWQDEVAGLSDRQDDLLMNASLAGGLDKAGYVDEYDALGRQADQIRSMNQRLLGYTPAPENPMFPGREVVYHGGYDWSPSATPEHPYGMFDTSRLKTNEGNNAFGPGAYFADVSSTSAGYRQMAQDKLLEANVENPMHQLRSVIEGLTDVMSEPIDVNQMRNFFQAQADNPVMARAGQLFDIIDRHDYFGADKNDLFFWEEMQKAMTSKKDLEDYIGRYEPEALDALSKLTTDQYVGKARLYTLDAPAGSKDRFLKWDSPLAEQPSAVRDALGDPRGLFSGEALTLIDEAAAASKRLDEAASRLKKIEAGGTRGTKYRQAEMDLYNAKNDYLGVKKKLLDMPGVPYDMAIGRYSDLSQMDGETVADLLMGVQPSSANLEDVAGLKAAGVPGVKNLAGSTGGQTFNYAVWDQDLLNQMRVRAIDGERVPINPTTLVVQQPQRVIPQIADSPLTAVQNPMALQQMPGMMSPAMQGALYQALARFNTYGGTQ